MTARTPVPAVYEACTASRAISSHVAGIPNMALTAVHDAFGPCLVISATTASSKRRTSAGRRKTSSQLKRSTSQPCSTSRVVAAAVRCERGAMPVELKGVRLEHQPESLIGEVHPTQELRLPDRDLRADAEPRDFQRDGPQRGLERVRREGACAPRDTACRRRASPAQLVSDLHEPLVAEAAAKGGVRHGEPLGEGQRPETVDQGALGGGHEAGGVVGPQFAPVRGDRRRP